jgi:tRNA pseudouridine32 synthase / 23S rRNA pseudouridine746 synthase
MKILWQDEALLVVDKPAGLPTLPDGWNIATPYLKGLLEKQVGRVWIVHRLDRETSGVIVLARSAQAHRELNRQFEQRLVQKIYHALVSRTPAWDLRSVDLPLRINSGHRHRTVVDSRQGKTALTRLRLLERWENGGLIEAVPTTGRTHQIRVHLAAIGYPILGDTLYGGFRDGQKDLLPRKNCPAIQRTALHARSIHFVHPASGEHVQFEADYPQDIQDAITLLRQKPTQNC